MNELKIIDTGNEMLSTRTRTLIYLLSPVLLIGLVFRLILTVKEFPLPLFDWMLVFINGSINDLQTASFLIPFLFPIVLWIDLSKRSHLLLINSLMTAIFAFFLWVGICEWFFWDEFSTRFNFIAVDYLIYTREVLGNIQESFNLPFIVILYLVALTSSVFLVTRLQNKLIASNPSRLKDPVWISILLTIFAFTQSPIILKASKNMALEEIGKNGTYEFFSAFRNNEINYKKMYANISKKRMLEVMNEEFATPNHHPKMIQIHKIYKEAIIKSVPKDLNLIFIAVESLGAKFIGPLGNKSNLTPHLNELSKKSLFFSNIYATGTRTVRGLEALTLAIPPTPGASIVRRPKNSNLMSIGRVLQKNGYETKFIYGGHGIFDNMNDFFRKNNYQIVDRTNFEDNEITFSNVWGVADENLFDKVLKESDDSYKRHQKFFSMVLTTSNHRPFTYPDGKIDIPSQTSRAGAVKYTDYAIGRFLKMAESKPWFKDTIFVVVADHSTEGRGVIDVPVETYHIPLFIYSPGNITPKVISRLASQIDVVPTVLSLMGQENDHIFFGKNIFEMKKSDERFFVGTYQKVGMYKDGHFISLGPKRSIEGYKYNTKKKKLTGTGKDRPKEIVELTQAYYQYASFLFRKGLYNDDFTGETSHLRKPRPVKIAEKKN